MSCLLQEYNIAEKERAHNQKSNEVLKLPKPDYIGVVGLLVAFFFSLFIYVLLETLAEPFVTDQYAVSDEHAMVSVGIALVIGGLLSTGMYVVTTKLAKIYDERILMIFMGMIPIAVGTYLYLPMGNTPIVMSQCANETSMATTFAMESTTPANDALWNKFHAIPVVESHEKQFDFFYASLRTNDVSEEDKNCTLGCPQSQEWCNTVPMLPLAQLIVAYVITITGYPVVQALSQALFSKMLGPQPQGLWMGILTGVGSLSRIAGPVFVSYVYTYNGTYWTFGTLAVGMTISVIELCILYKRFVPMVVPTSKTGYDNKIAEDEV